MFKKIFVWIIAALIILQISVYAIECEIILTLYDPEDTPVDTISCFYESTDEDKEISCSMPFDKCFMTGLYTLNTDDTSDPLCTGIDETDDFAICDVTPPNMVGTSPAQFSVAVETDGDGSVNASWNVYEDDMLLYYAFEDNDATDWTNESRDGIITGIDEYFDGYRATGQAAYFDGTDDYINISDDLGDPSGATISLWLNATNWNSRAYILDARKGGNWNFTLDDNSGSCAGTDGNLCFDGRAEIVKTQLNWTNSTWIHVVVTWDSTSTIMYVDGINLTTGTGEDPDFGPSIIIGTKYDLISSIDWTGSMDEIMIFNKTLTKSEVINLYLSGLVTHSLHVAPDAIGSEGPYASAIGYIEKFKTNNTWADNFTATGETADVLWSVSGEAGVATVSTPTDYSCKQQKYLNMEGHDVLIKYDVKFAGDAKTGGINYSGVFVAINPNSSGWHDDDSDVNFSGINNSGEWFTVKLYIFGNRSGKVTSALDVDRKSIFFEELINVSSFANSKIGIVSPKDAGTMTIDNFEVIYLEDGISSIDTNSTDIDGPVSPTLKPVGAIDFGSIGMSWDPATDSGTSYYYYLVGIDSSGNPSNLLQNVDFESALFSPWEGDGLTPAATSTDNHYGNYSLSVTTSGVGEGVYQSVEEFTYYKGNNLYFECFVRTVSGTGDIQIGADTFTNHNSSIEVSTTWQKISHAGTVDSGAGSLNAYIKSNESAGISFYIDSCSLQFYDVADVAVGIKDYRLNRTSGGTPGTVYGWGTSTNTQDTGLNCFTQYGYTLETRDDKGTPDESGSSNEELDYAITTDECEYFNIGEGYCLDHKTEDDDDGEDDVCYTRLNEPCVEKICEMPGNSSGNYCWFDDNLNGLVDRSDDCQNVAYNDGCNVTSFNHPSCDVGDFDDMTIGSPNADCWAGTNCYYNDSYSCSNNTGWSYQTDSTDCTAPDTTCCVTEATRTEGDGCSDTGETGTAYDRDTTETRCEATDTGCTEWTWTNVSDACCGDDEGSDTFFDVGYEAGSCEGGAWSDNHCTDSATSAGETSEDYGGPWCNDRPELNTLLLNASSENNYTVDNITVYYTVRENDTDTFFPIVDWRIDGKSIAVLNMPFERDNQSDGTIKDFSSFENNGTGVNGVGWTQYGFIGGAMNFDGINDYINATNHSSFNNTDSLGIILWAKPTTLQSCVLVAKEGAYMLNISASALRGVIHDGSKYQNLSYAISSNEWYLIGLSYNQNQLKLYINGSEAASKAVTGTITANPNEVILGSLGGSTLFFPGLLDEVRIFNRSLTPEQITAIYNQEKNSYSKLVLDMHFGQNASFDSDLDVRDYSQYGNNGTLGSGTQAWAPIWNDTGQIGGSYYFDGLVHYINISDSHSLDPSAVVSIATWVKDPPVGYVEPKSGPEIISASVNPTKVRPGDQMEIKAEITDKHGIENVTAAMEHDKGNDELLLTLVEGTQFDGSWQATWIVHDTVEKAYTTKLTGVNVLGETSSENIKWYDPIGYVNTYEFSDTTNNKAYYKNGTATTPFDYDAEVNAGNYTAMETSDNSRSIVAKATQDGGYDTQVYTFTITETIADISNLTVEWEGYGEDTASYYTNISFWNWSGSSWKEVDNNDFTASTDAILTGAITSSVSDFINSSNKMVAVRVTSKNALESSSCEDVCQAVCSCDWTPTNCWTGGPAPMSCMADGGSECAPNLCICNCAMFCPFIYSWNGTEYEYDTQIIYNISSKSQETLQYRNLTKASANGDELWFQVREEEPETSYIDELFIEVEDSNGEEVVVTKLYPSFASRDLYELLVEDENYLVTNFGDVVDLRFSGVPQLPQGWDRKIRVGARGYYEFYGEQEKPSIHDTGTHNSLNTDYVELRVNADRYIITNLPAGLDLQIIGNSTYNLSSIPASGTANVLINKSGIAIANFSMDFTQDMDFSGITADANSTHSVIHIDTSTHTYVNPSFTLRIPVVDGSNITYICPNAQTITDVNKICSGKYWVTGLTNISGYYHVKVTGSGGAEGDGSQNKTIVDKGGAYGLMLNGTGDVLIGRINDKTVSYAVANPLAWHYHVMTYDGANIKLYIDGTLVNTTAYSSAITVNTNETLIGDYFSGLIDEVKIFNATLSQQEITNMYNEGLDLRSSVLVANETVEGDNFTAMIWGSDNILLSANYTSNWIEIQNSPPTLIGISVGTDPIAGGQTQTVTATTPRDNDQENLYMYCCNDTDDSCTPSSSVNVCVESDYAYPYSGMECTWATPYVDENPFYVRCVTNDGTTSSAIISDSFVVDSTAPTVDVLDPPNNYVRGTQEINASVSDAGVGLKDNSCKWSFEESGVSWTAGSDDFAQEDASGKCYYDLDTSGYDDGTLYIINWTVNDTINNKGNDSDAESAYVCNELDVANCGQACEDQTSPDHFYNGGGFHTFDFEAGTTANCCEDDVAETFVNYTIGASWYISCCDNAGDCVDETSTCRDGIEGTGSGNCNDGFDNDCDSLIDFLDDECCPTVSGSLFVVQNATRKNCTMVDEDGDMSILGDLTTSCGDSPGANDFIVRTNAGSVVFFVDSDNCNACLAGTVNQDEASISAGTNEFLVMNSAGDYVMKIDNSGDLYLTGFLGATCD